MNGMQIMRGETDQPALGQGELYVLAMLREVIAISEAEPQGSRGYVGCNCYEQEQPKPGANTGHDEEGHLALMGYYK